MFRSHHQVQCHIGHPLYLTFPFSGKHLAMHGLGLKSLIVGPSPLILIRLSTVVGSRQFRTALIVLSH